MDDIMKQLESEGAQEGATSLAELTGMAELALDIEAEIAQLEADLKEAKGRYNKIVLDKLPLAMQNAKSPSFEVTKGGVNRKVSFKEEMSCNVPKKRLDEIVAKLRTEEYDAGDMIKNTITIELGAGKDNAAGEIMAKAEEVGVEAVRQETVNTASLKALLKARRKDNKSDDLSFFGAYVVTKATIK